MERDKGRTYSAETHRKTSERMKESGESTTAPGEQRERQGLGLDPLVDPKSRGGWREALTLMVPQPEGTFMMPYGVALPIQSDADTTGSIGKENIKILFDSLPRTHELITTNPQAILAKSGYHVQMCTGSIQDFLDKYPYRRSEYEPDNEIATQMRLLFPECQGWDETEDYQVGLYFVGQKTRTSIRRYSRKGYYFPIGDEIGRDNLFKNKMEKSALMKVWEKQNLPQDMDTRSMAEKVLADWHTFYLQVWDKVHATKWWSEMIGSDRVVIMTDHRYVAEYQAVLIGLTEGVIDLQNAVDFLTDVAKINRRDAERIVRSVSHIPVGAQMSLCNGMSLPPEGSIFASRDDVWPIGWKDGQPLNAEAVASEKPEEGAAAGDINWQL